MGNANLPRKSWDAFADDAERALKGAKYTRRGRTQFQETVVAGRLTKRVRDRRTGRWVDAAFNPTSGQWEAP